MAVVDTDGKKVKIMSEGMVRVDGVSVFRKIEREGIIYLQFYDKDTMRAKCRGSRLIEIPLETMITLLKNKEENGSESPAPTIE